MYTMHTVVNIYGRPYHVLTVMKVKTYQKAEFEILNYHTFVAQSNLIII